jgi:CBS domain containing-hemolysin-like protein
LTIVIVIIGAILCVALCIITFVQTLFLENMRLRTRDLPSLQYFKETLEDRLGFKNDEGTLSFSLLKHGTLLMLGIFVFAVFQGSTDWLLFLEAAFTAWLIMMFAAYIIPQMLYRRSSGHMLTPLVPVLRLLSLLIRPVVGLLNFFQSLAELTDEATQAAEPPTSAESIDALITAGAEEGLLQEDDRKLIQSVVEFGDKVVREVMTPRPEMVALDADETLERLRQLVINEQYSRIPVYTGDIDHVAGFVHVRDMFELGEAERLTMKIRELMRPIRFVPETKPVHDLMREMQHEGAHMVIVVDEYGNTAGLCTMEDLVEVILGEIRDEHEPDSDVTEEPDGAYVVAGTFDLDRLKSLLEFDPTEEIESTTVGGLVTEWLGRVPPVGEFVERDGINIEILASDGLRVEKVRVRKAAMHGPEPEKSDTAVE